MPAPLRLAYNINRSYMRVSLQENEIVSNWDIILFKVGTWLIIHCFTNLRITQLRMEWCAVCLYQGLVYKHYDTVTHDKSLKQDIPL